MDMPLTTPTSDTAADPLEESFDLLARQEKTEGDVAALRGDVEEVKARIDRIGRAATRPAPPPAPRSRASSRDICGAAARRK